MIALLLAVLATPPAYGHVGDLQGRGMTAAAGGEFGATITTKDDVKFCRGDTTCNYWDWYDTTATAGFELYTTDGNGAGADTILLQVDDGTDDICLPNDGQQLQLGGSCGSDADVTWDGDSLNWTGATEYAGTQCVAADSVASSWGASCASDASVQWDGDSLNWTGATEYAGSQCLAADSVKSSWGNACPADSYIDFDGTNLRVYSSGDVEFLASPIVGTIEFDADSGAVTGMNMEVSATPAAGTEQSVSASFDSTTHTKFYCEADGAGSIEDCHLIQSYPPVLVPSSDQSLSADAAFDCDEGINRIAGNGGAVILSAAPSINDGDVDGQVCYVQGTSANTVQINDNTNVQLAGGANFVMGKGDMLILVWDAGDSDWYELSRSDN